MGENGEPLYDDETVRLMSEAYEAADKKLGTPDKALQVTMAVAIIRAINDGERDSARLTLLALSAVRDESRPEPEPERQPRPGWINLAALLN